VPDATHDVINGGIQGCGRLRVLARVMHPASTSLFDRLDAFAADPTTLAGARRIVQTWGRRPR
jgi:hypothetical protein